jgi:hypothetical protein
MIVGQKRNEKSFLLGHALVDSLSNGCHYTAS